MLSVGQVVVLKSGGPDMVVTSSKDLGNGQLVSVLWYAKNNGRSQFNTASDLPASAFKPSETSIELARKEYAGSQRQASILAGALDKLHEATGLGR